MNRIDYDHTPLYQNKCYRKALELINENVPLSVVKRRWHVKTTVNKCNAKHVKQQHRNAIVMDARVVTYEHKSSKVSFAVPDKQ